MWCVVILILNFFAASGLSLYRIHLQSESHG